MKMLYILEEGGGGEGGEVTIPLFPR